MFFGAFKNILLKSRRPKVSILLLDNTKFLTECKHAYYLINFFCSFVIHH